MSDDHHTASDIVYEALLADLRSRVWSADSRLKTTDLAQRYGAASGAVREALIRLSAEGFVVNFPQRGFRTIAGSEQSIWEQANFRVAIEVEAARLSIERGDLAWEANLSAAHHRLSHLEARLPKLGAYDDETLKLWSDADLAFHEALIAACGSSVLITQQRYAFIRFRLHLTSIAEHWGFRGAALVQEHAAILDAALNRDADACAAAIRAHFDYYPNTINARASAAE